MVLLFASNLAGRAAIYPGSNAAWLVVASRDNPNSAISYARQLARSAGNVAVFRSNNGWYAISLGWINRSSGNTIASRLKSRGVIPHDSYFHSGERFVELIWSSSGVTGTNGSAILSSTKLNVDGGTPVTIDRSSNGPGYVSGLLSNGDGYVSFRSGPSTSRTEIKRLTQGTPFEIIGKRKGWYNVRIQSGRSGWLYSRYVTPGIAYVQPVKPATPVVPKPEIAISEVDNGTKLRIFGLAKAGFDFVALRKGPGSNYLEVARLREGTNLVVTGKYQDWYRVKPAPSVEGWVKVTYLAAAEVPTFGPPDNDITPKDKPTKKPETIDIAVIKNPSPVGEEDKPEKIGKRVALVLGNSAYQHTTALPNPKNDAARVAEKLKQLGFIVIIGLDGGKSAMERTIRDFVRELPNSEAALFFYAGHAMQVKGSNYLIPIDAKLEDSTALDFETIQLSSILQFVDQPGRVSIALIDACRDNPLSRRFARSVGATRSAFIGRGLASPSSSGNLLIGFATAPGEVALDGDGENSPFTTALLNHIGTPKLEIEAMLKRVRSDVFVATDQQQSPWTNSGLRKNFYFKN